MAMSEVTYNGQQVMLIYLTFWDKVAIVAGAIGFLLLVSMCMVCFLCPTCLHETFCCTGSGDDDDKEEKKRKTASQRSSSSRSSYGSTGSDYYYGAPPPDIAVDTGPLKWKPLDIIKEYDNGGFLTQSDWSSDASGREGVELDVKKEQLPLPPKQNGFHHNTDVDDSNVTPQAEGVIDFTLAYSVSDEKLIIKIIQIENLKLTESWNLVSPYVKIRLYRTPKQFFTFGGTSDKDHVINNLDKEVKTKMQRPSDVLTYKESFEISIDSEYIRDYTLRLLLCDMDKLSRHVVLGETSVTLRKTDILNVNELTFREDLGEPKEENLGTIRLGLSYLPTSEKMYLSVDSIKGLKVMDKKVGSTDACVKAYLMYDGKQLKRIKTTVRSMDLNPVFNESFSFDVPQNELGKVYFSLVISHYNAEKKGTKLIGRVYMGMNFEPTARDHWANMMQNPRQKSVCTYKIIN